MKRISVQLIRVFGYLEGSSASWRSVAEAANGAGVSAAAAKSHLKGLVGMKLVLQADTYAYRYRLVSDPAQANPKDYARILQAREALGESEVAQRPTTTQDNGCSRQVNDGCTPKRTGASEVKGRGHPDGGGPSNRPDYQDLESKKSESAGTFESAVTTNPLQSKGVAPMFSFYRQWSQMAISPIGAGRPEKDQELSDSTPYWRSPLVAGVIAQIERLERKPLKHIKRSRYMYEDGRRLLIVSSLGYTRKVNERRFSITICDSSIHFLHRHLRSELVVVCGSLSRTTYIPHCRGLQGHMIPQF